MLKNLGTKKTTLAVMASFLVAGVLLFFYALLRHDAPQQIFLPGAGDETLLLNGTARLEDGSMYPIMLFINPRDWSVETIDVNTLFPGLNATEIIRAKSFLLNGEYKLAITTRGAPEAPTSYGTMLILGRTGRSWANLQIEFREELPDSFVRALFIGDITGNGKEEIVVGTRLDGLLKYYAYENGQWSGTTIDKLGASVAIHDLFVADLDENGLQEIVLTAHEPMSQLMMGAKELSRLKPKILQYELNQARDKWSKEVLWEYTEAKPPNRAMPDAPDWLIDKIDKYDRYPHARFLFFVDVDGDGEKEITINQPNGPQYLAVFKRQENSWNQEVIEDELPLKPKIIAVGDVDNDGKSEIIAATQSNDALLLYEYEQGAWQRTIIVEGLMDKTERETVQFVYVLKSSEGKYKNILYMISENNKATSHFYLLSYDGRKDEWQKQLVAKLGIGIHAWHVTSALPKSEPKK